MLVTLNTGLEIYETALVVVSVVRYRQVWLGDIVGRNLSPQVFGNHEAYAGQSESG
ncbi:hypothetical protein D3C84_1178570 [compost metagenome]